MIDILVDTQEAKSGGLRCCFTRIKYDAPCPSVLGDHVKGDGGARRGVTKRDGAVPHIRREQDQPPGDRLNGAADGIFQRDLKGGFAEFDPALALRLVLHRIGHRNIVAGTDPALGVGMIDMEPTLAKPRRPGSGIAESPRPP